MYRAGEDMNVLTRLSMDNMCSASNAEKLKEEKNYEVFLAFG
jgi:hypothetical protein